MSQAMLIFHFPIFVVTPGYMLTSKDLDPEFTNKRKHAVFVLEFLAIPPAT